jgi:glycosyltransferase involved in cell wall biosynthesis
MKAPKRMSDLNSNRLCVLQLVPRLDAGGVERTAVEISAGIRNVGGRALIATSGGRMVKDAELAGAEVFLMPLDSKNPIVMAQNVRKIADLIRREDVRIVHARSRAPAWSGIRAADICHIPFVTTYHGIYSEKNRIKKMYNSIMTKGEIVIANSNFTKDHILSRHAVSADKIVTIPRGVDTSSFDVKVVDESKVANLRADWEIDNQDSVVFLLPARFTRWKGHELVIRAAQELLDSGIENFHVVLAGQAKDAGPYMDELDAMTPPGSSLNDHVSIREHISDMPAAYAASDFVLSPSVEPEAFGRTVAEAMSMERPVLASDHGAPAETVVDGVTGWLVPSGDVHAWAAAMRRAILAPPEERRAMGLAGRERVRQHYSLSTMVDATLAVYEDLLTTKKGKRAVRAESTAR